jgi:hypothetical protein
VTTAEGPSIANDEVPGAFSMHVAPPAIRIVVIPVGVTVLLGLYNPPRSWTGMVSPSLPDFTIALVWIPCCAIGLIRRPKFILQDSPEVEGTYMHFTHLHISCLTLT